MHPNEPSVSVVIITHNRHELVLEALASATRQTLRPTEIILVDDGSSPPVSESLTTDSIVLAEIPVRIVRLDGRGPSAARNAGAAVAAGAYLAFLDDDDQWMPDYLRCCVETLGQAQAQCTISWLRCFDDRRQWPGKAIPEQLEGVDLFARNPGVVGSNIVIERKAFEDIGGFDEDLLGSEDKDFLIRSLAGRLKVEVHPRPLVLYRVHGEGQVSGHGAFHRFQVSGKTRFLDKYADDMPPETRRLLAAEAGYFRFMGGDSLTMRLEGLWSVLSSDPLLLARRGWWFLRRHMRSAACRFGL